MNNISGDCAVLIVAGGRGSRMSPLPNDTPKQLRPLLGLPVYAHSVQRFAAHPSIGKIFIAVRAGDAQHYTRISAHPNVTLLETAGDTRQATVRQSLDAIAADGQAPHRILVHDAARPCWSPQLLERLLATTADAAAPAVAVPDTLRRIIGDASTTTIDRAHVYMVQTPQLFSFGTLHELHRQHASSSVTDDAQLFELAGAQVTYVTGERDNLKITVEDDMAVAAGILSLAAGDIRTATGYDVHEFIAATPDRPLRLGGITLPYHTALKGHSDADVVLHAITDALLGCIAAQDIGYHFSPKDQRWKDADSTMFLAHARDMITARGGLITHIDTTIICEEPKIGPHRESMQEAIAGILHIEPARVSVKATTSEGLGFTGRREGMAAQAAATVRLPFTTPLTSESKSYA